MVPNPLQKRKPYLPSRGLHAAWAYTIGRQKYSPTLYKLVHPSSNPSYREIYMYINPFNLEADTPGSACYLSYRLVLMFQKFYIFVFQHFCSQNPLLQAATISPLSRFARYMNLAVEKTKIFTFSIQIDGVVEAVHPSKKSSSNYTS